MTRCPVCGLYMTVEGMIRRVVPASRHLGLMRMWHWDGCKFRQSGRWERQLRCKRCGYRAWEP